MADWKSDDAVQREGTDASGAPFVPATTGQHTSLAIPDAASGNSLLRLGYPPGADECTVIHESWNRASAATLPHWGAGGLTPNDGAAFKEGFVHHALSVTDLLNGTRLVSHTDGDRLSTTKKSKVELVEGSYKLIASGGGAGFDISEGHMQAWSATPGYMSQVTKAGNRTTDSTVAPVGYHYRFKGGSYDEHWALHTYRSRAGYPALKPGYKAPPPENSGPVYAFEESWSEVRSTKIDSVVSAAKSSSKVTAKKVVEHTRVGGTAKSIACGDVKDNTNASKIHSVLVAGKKVEDVAAVGKMAAVTVMTETMLCDDMGDGAPAAAAFVSPCSRAPKTPLSKHEGEGEGDASFSGQCYTTSEISKNVIYGGMLGPGGFSLSQLGTSPLGDPNACTSLDLSMFRIGTTTVGLYIHDLTEAMTTSASVVAAPLQASGTIALAMADLTIGGLIVDWSESAVQVDGNAGAEMRSKIADIQNSALGIQMGAIRNSS